MISEARRRACSVTPIAPPPSPLVSRSPMSRGSSVTRDSRSVWSRIWNSKIRILNIFDVLGHCLILVASCLYWGTSSIGRQGQTSDDSREYLGTGNNTGPLWLSAPLAGHWAQMLGLLAIEPFHDTVDVKTVCTCSPDQRTIISRKFAVYR